MAEKKLPELLPLSMDEVRARGWDAVDFVCVTGDSYVDHPSFGIAIISRVLESEGFRAAILAQPQGDEDYRRYGRPRLGFFVTGGNIDSMVCHYTAGKRRRSDDPYTAGNKAGSRPDRAPIVYSRRIKALYPGSPVILGGLEASFRRFAHYDYWEDKVRPSILTDSGADLLSFGMGENQTRQIARRLAKGEEPKTMTDIRGTCYLTENLEAPPGSISCASFEKVSRDKAAFAKAYRLQAGEQDPVYGKTVVQRHGNTLLVQNPPMPPLTREELDAVFALPYSRSYHPSYERKGGVKAIEEVEFSIQHNRGCFGGCAFCSIAFHQGRQVTSRSASSILKEARLMTESPRFKGYIHDVGGATANFRGPSCDRQKTHGVCRNRRCLAPSPCPNLKVDHTEYLDILRSLRKLPKVKRVFIRSGLRYDYINQDKDGRFLSELVEHHISGQLKVAPEHCVAHVLDAMGKPHIDAFERFSRQFYQATRKTGKEQYLVPYLMSSHPGSTLRDAVELALFLKKRRLRPEQVQDFYPTPGTASTCMFYTGLDPAAMKPVTVVRDPHEKKLQRALLQYFKPENRALVIEALKKAGRQDLIGFGSHCLIGPDRESARERRNTRQAPASRAAPKSNGGNARLRPASRKNTKPGKRKTSMEG